MKKLIFYLVLFRTVFLNENITAQTISDKCFGQNFWISKYGGHFGTIGLEDYWSEIVASGVKWMRIGGTAYDAVNNYTGTSYTWTPMDLASGSGSIISTLRSHGIEPIVQVPIDITQTVAWNAATCSTLVHDVNVTYSGNVTYWEIGNEPNIQYTGTNNYNTDAVIASYIIAVSDAMKGVSGQSGIKIIGPSLAGYNTTSYNNFLGGSADISGSGTNGFYIDYISFNTYPLGGEANLQSEGRTDVITNLTAANHLKDNLAAITTRITSNTTRTTSNLKIAITEANISYEQNTLDKGVTGIGPGSFIAGQFWCEMMAIAMEKGVEFLTFWSILEGSSAWTPTSPYVTDIGYISKEYSKIRPTYWHYKLMATNFSGTYYANSHTYTNYKAFAYKNTSEIGVLIMNQDQQSPRGTDQSTQAFTINFNNTAGSSGMDFAFPMGVSATYSGCSIQKETTMLLKFSLAGAFQSSQTYSLQDALRGASDVGPNSYTGGTETINTSTDYVNARSNNDKIYTTVSISGTSNISPGTVGNNTYQFTGSATISGSSSGTFSSGASGNTLCITAADATCH